MTRTTRRTARDRRLVRTVEETRRDRGRDALRAAYRTGGFVPRQLSSLG